jgi:hypothetical protein
MANATTGIKTVDDAITRLENTRQAAIAAATTQAAAISAEVAYHRGFVKLAISNGVSPAASMSALHEISGVGQ